MWRSAGPSILLTLAALALCQTGCHTVRPRYAFYDLPAAAQSELARGKQLESAGDDACVDAYFQACAFAWPALGGNSLDGDCYNAAIERLLQSACRFRRLDPARGLVIREGQQSIAVPVVHQGFAWQAHDFQRLHPPPRGHEPLLVRRYACAGVGLPLVIERGRNDCNANEARFLPEKSFFAASAVLRFGAELDSAQSATSAVLEFHNPQYTGSVNVLAAELPLSRDLSAPLAQTLDEAPRTYFSGFIEPGGAGTTARLNFLEPYQSGKAPVVLIHGLFSDPLSWADLVNDLRATPGFSERYQLWVFRYPSGLGFLQSAQALRAELRAAAVQLDPDCRDEALRNMVLIGHSMGGLISKLQVTYSDELVWSRVANRPLEEIITTEPVRARLAETCYFEPSPYVARVIFIASPHCGSLHSSTLFGKGASLLVEEAPEQAAMHEQLVRDNPHTFNPLLERRFPTSIDMLAPDSPLLAAMQQMRLRPGVKLHNIVGVSHPLSLDGPSDGVVAVTSATHPGCVSVLAVGAPHAKVHRACETSAEILRILGCPSQHR